MSRAWSLVILKLRHNSFKTKGILVQMVNKNGGTFKRFWNFPKKIVFNPNRLFFAEVHWFYPLFQEVLQFLNFTNVCLDMLRQKEVPLQGMG